MLKTEQLTKIVTKSSTVKSVLSYYSAQVHFNCKSSYCVIQKNEWPAKNLQQLHQGLT